MDIRHDESHRRRMLVFDPMRERAELGEDLALMEYLGGAVFMVIGQRAGEQDVRIADATALPLDDASADLAVAFMSLHDIDAMPAVVSEIARILQPGGKVCLAIVHPINSAGYFAHKVADAPFVVEGDYLRSFRYSDTVERDGWTMTFHSQHRPLEAYFLALEAAGLLVEALREPSIPEHAITSEATRRWQRLPLFLHIRAYRP